MNRHIKISMTGPQTGKVWIGGEEVKEVIGVRFEVNVERDQPSHVTITRRVYGTVELEGQCDVTVLDNNGSRRWIGSEAG